MSAKWCVGIVSVIGVAFIALLVWTLFIDDTYHSVEVHPKFKAGQCVQFSDDSFYSRCFGTIKSYERYDYVHKGESANVTYGIHFFCQQDALIPAEGETNEMETKLRVCQ